MTTGACRYKALFGEGDAEKRILRSASRFGVLDIATPGSCNPVSYARKEELYFVLKGKGILHAGGKTLPIRASDFTYIAPGVAHSLENDSGEPLQVLLMTFQIPDKAVVAATPETRVVNMDALKEEMVGGHPSSVLYKLMVGPRGAKRDAIDEAYSVVSLFWMDFAPGGTNFPHHHEVAEEIYLVIDGQGEMSAGSGQDGVEARFPVKAGDAYYFRPNCTVGFYNQSKPDAKAHILAVRSRMPLPQEED